MNVWQGPATREIARRLGRTLVLKHEGQRVTIVFCLECDVIGAARALQHLGHGCHVDTNTHVAIAAKVVEAVSTNQE